MAEENSTSPEMGKHIEPINNIDSLDKIWSEIDALKIKSEDGDILKPVDFLLQVNSDNPKDQPTKHCYIEAINGQPWLYFEVNGADADFSVKAINTLLPEKSDVVIQTEDDSFLYQDEEGLMVSASFYRKKAETFTVSLPIKETLLEKFSALQLLLNGTDIYGETKEEISQKILEKSADHLKKLTVQMENQEQVARKRDRFLDLFLNSELESLRVSSSEDEIFSSVMDEVAEQSEKNSHQLGTEIMDSILERIQKLKNTDNGLITFGPGFDFELKKLESESFWQSELPQILSELINRDRLFLSHTMGYQDVFEHNLRNGAGGSSTIDIRSKDFEKEILHDLISPNGDIVTLFTSLSLDHHTFYKGGSGQGGTLAQIKFRLPELAPITVFFPCDTGDASSMLDIRDLHVHRRRQNILSPEDAVKIFILRHIDYSLREMIKEGSGQKAGDLLLNYGTIVEGNTLRVVPINNRTTIEIVTTEADEETKQEILSRNIPISQR